LNLCCLKSSSNSKLASALSRQDANNLRRPFLLDKSRHDFVAAFVSCSVFVYKRGMNSVSNKPKSVSAAVGFRVKSGWAAAVLLAGPTESPRVLDCRRVEPSDPAAPESWQPYHAGTGALEDSQAKVAQRINVVECATNKSVTRLLEAYRAMGCALRGAALVVGSLSEPEAISNPHIRAHALEGRLFRTVLEQALKLHGLTCVVMLEKSAYAKAAAALGRTEAELKRVLADLGRSVSGPWRADEKLAALAAWGDVSVIN
jgi:hypothetical protein